MTLVELLVASVLMGTVLVVLAQMVTLATRTSTDAHREVGGLQLLKTLMTRLKTGELAINTDTDGDFTTEEIAGYRYEVRQKQKEDNAKLYEVTVTVYWPTAVGESSVAATRIFYQPDDEERSEEK